MKLVRYRALLSVLVTLLAVFGLWSAGFAYIAHQSAALDETLEGLEPRYQRLHGLRGAAAEIEQSLAATRAALSRAAYPATHSLDRIGPEVQQRLRVAAEAGGVSVTGSQIVPATTSATADRGLDVVRVVLNIEGDLAQILVMFDKISEHAPAVYLDAFEVRPVMRGGRRLSARVQYSVLRVQE
jgi:general secretion pathway protein M